jgi:hypothetical protein
MGNNKRYWLRGGVIIGGIYLIILTAYIIFVLSSNIDPADKSFAFILVVMSGIPLTLILEKISFLNKLLDHSLLSTVVIVCFVSIFQWFIIGSFFGWIYGKIVNRNKV